MKSFFKKIIGKKDRCRQKAQIVSDIDIRDDALIRNIKNPFEVFESWMKTATSKEVGWSVCRVYD